MSFQPSSPDTINPSPSKLQLSSWVVNELPVIQEEPNKEKRAGTSSNISSGFPSKSTLSTPKQSLPKLSQADEVTQTPGSYQSPDINDSFERLKTLLKTASFTSSSSSSTTEVNDAPADHYENLGFVDWDEDHTKSAPGNLDVDFPQPPPPESLRRNLTAISRKPEFRLSGSSCESDNRK